MAIRNNEAVGIRISPETKTLVVSFYSSNNNMYKHVYIHTAVFTDNKIIYKPPEPDCGR